MSANGTTSPTSGTQDNHADTKIKRVVSPSQQQPQQDKKVFYSTGRGGAGNIKKTDLIPSPKIVSQGSNTPTLTGDTITTGRGGYGNMFKNSDPELTRKLQDVDGNKSKNHLENELHQVTSFSVGRGGFGNVISNTKSRTSQNSGSLSDQQPNSLMAISSHGQRKIVEEDGEGPYAVGDLRNAKKKKSFINKLKGFFST